MPQDPSSFWKSHQLKHTSVLDTPGIQGKAYINRMFGVFFVRRIHFLNHGMHPHTAFAVGWLKHTVHTYPGFFEWLAISIKTARTLCDKHKQKQVTNKEN